MKVHCAKMHTANADYYALQSTMLGRRGASEGAEKPFFTALRLEMSDGSFDLCGGTTDRVNLLPDWNIGGITREGFISV